MAEDNGLFLNFLMTSMFGRTPVPEDYHGQVDAVKTMMTDDLSGMVDSLTDFQVASASVNYSIETPNPKFTAILQKWLDTINISYLGLIPTGITELSKEYFKERWKSSSFPVLRISKWEAIDGVILPVNMFFVDGESIHAKDKDLKDKNKSLLSYDYFLDDKGNIPLKKNVIIDRPFGRWYDKYTTPYLVKRGVYHNWRIIKSLKNMQTKILDQVIPYIFMIKKGSAQLASNQIKTYSNPELNEILKNFQSLMDEMKNASVAGKSSKSPIRVTNFDEELKHLIPDLSTIMSTELFAQAERNILSGMGFVDVIQGISDSRRESILNPKGFIEEVNKGVEDFKNHILKTLVYMIIEKNKDHRKYIASPFHITSSPVKAFMTDDFRNQLRMLWERGMLSSETYCEMVGEVEFKSEVTRRTKEAKSGVDYVMYPHLTKNQEDKGIDLTGNTPDDLDKNGKPIPNDKVDDKEKFDRGLTNLETAPYTNITELPSTVKKQLSPSKQKKWMSIFNSAYAVMFTKSGSAKTAETYAFRVAWSQVKQVKAKKKTKKVKPVKSKKQIKKEEAESAMQKAKLKKTTKQTELLEKLLKNKDN